MRIKKQYEETTSRGLEKVIEQSNGVVIRVLKEPSEDYKKLKEKSLKESEKQLKQEQEKMERDKLIQERMKQIAEQQLIDEGLIESK